MTELTAPQAPSSRRRAAADAKRRLAAQDPDRETQRDARSARFDRVTLGLGLAAALILLGWAAAHEAETSSLQSLFVSRAVKDMTFAVEPGPSTAIRFPEAGPYDRRLGYAQLPSFIDRLTARHFVVESQARQSPLLGRFIDAGGYPVYHEEFAGRSGAERPCRDAARSGALSGAAYPSFDAVPSLVAHTLRFIEDRYLLDPDHPNRNPAVEWRRFGMAALGRAGSSSPRPRRAAAAARWRPRSRNSAIRRAGGPGRRRESCGRWSTASARTYPDGPDTLPPRQQIVTDLPELDAARLDARATAKSSASATALLGLVRHRFCRGQPRAATRPAQRRRDWRAVARSISRR